MTMFCMYVAHHELKDILFLLIVLFQYDNLLIVHIHRLSGVIFVAMLSAGSQMS